MKLINFKHIDPSYIERNFTGLACCEGSIGLAFDLSRALVVNNIIDPTVRASWLSAAKTGTEAAADLFIEQEDELQDLALTLPMMFNVGLHTFYWCFQCKNASSTYECGCPEHRGIESIDWDGIDPALTANTHRYKIHIQSLKPITVISFHSPASVDDICTDIAKRYSSVHVDSRFLFLFETLRTFGVPNKGETIQFAYDSRTVGHITCE